jgi:hypothetical protein
VKYDWNTWFKSTEPVELKSSQHFRIKPETMVKKLKAEALARGLIIRTWSVKGRNKRDVHFQVVGRTTDGCVYIGIDPGKNGGVAVLSPKGSLLAATGMPDSPKGLLDVMMEAKVLGTKYGEYLRVCIEKVGGFTGRTGVGGNFVARGSHMFEFGKATGWAEMAAVAVGATEIITVIPAVWQKSVGIEPRVRGDNGESDGEWKNRLKDRAAELFPKADITLKTADALLIGYYYWSKCEQ